LLSIASSKSVRNFAILLLVDGVLSLAGWYVLTILPETIMADLMFAEGAVLLVAGGIAGIYTLSPSLRRVKRYFDDRYESRMSAIVEKPQTTQPEPSNEKDGKTAKPEATSLMIVTWGIVLLVISATLSVLIVVIP
jgi:hypothetical protein